MPDDHRTETTELLERAQGGDAEAMNLVAERVHGDLLKVANRMAWRELGGGQRARTLEPAALVNETFVRLIKQREPLKNRAHFFGIATKVMLRALKDYDRTRKRRKRGGDWIQVSLGALGAKGSIDPVVDIPDLVMALEGLEQFSVRVARVVKLRALWGLSADETAEVLGTSRSTVNRDWRFGRSWLASRLEESAGNAPDLEG